MSRNSMKKLNRWEIDTRSAGDLELEIRELASSYTPEWRFDDEDPDIGTVLAKIFAEQMAGNITRYNQVLEKYHTEFVNILGISPKPAHPAMATVIMDPVQDTIPGVEVKKGTKLLAESEGEERQLVFETLHDLYATSAVVDYVFMTEKDGGKVIPLKGDFDPVLLPGESPEKKDEEAGPMPLRPFCLFDPKETGIEKNALIFYHSTAMDVEDDDIYLKIEGNRKLLEEIDSGNFVFEYYTEDGFIPVESVEARPDEERVVLRKQRENAKIKVGDGEYSMLLLKTSNPVREVYRVSSMSVSSTGKQVPAEFANSGTEDFDVSEFEPFGETLSLFQECYIGHDSYFSKAGALITVKFDLNMEEHRILTTPKEEQESLRVIKRKPKVEMTEAAADVYAEDVSLEYFNGLGWKKLECTSEVRNLFSTDKNTECEVSFYCPDDWEEAGVGAYQGRCLRLRLLKADNCYITPSVHHYPVIKGLTVSFTYEGTYMQPQRLLCVCGTGSFDLTENIRRSPEFTAFNVSEYTEDALYIGFNRRLEKGPVSLLFQMNDASRFSGVKCRFLYSSNRGFQQMKVLDQTLGMSRSGIVRFLPPADMVKTELEGKNAYWIKICPADEDEILIPEEMPRIENICFNAVETTNIETLEEEDFYLAQTGPNLEVNLGVTHILDAEIWVNEKESLSRPMMLGMLKDNPEEVRAEYDMMGEITAFYVKWQETDRLDFPASRRSYVLDRMNSTLIFGDGVLSDFPKVLNNVAFKATIRRCSGAEGNVEPDQIDSALDNLMFINRVYNPVKGYGGSSMESLSGALNRGADIIKSRRRLVSLDDYTEEILSYSDQIAQVKGLVGWQADGTKNDRALTFLILMKDFETGSYSFHNLSGTLLRHLQSACELTIAPEDLYLAEPVFARVSVELWVRVSHLDDSFEVQNLLEDTLEQYLNPVTGQNGEGWPIGMMPQRAQLLMRLNSLRSKAVVQKMAVTVAWHDRTGSHEVDLDSLTRNKNPFFVCCCGSHSVHTILAEE